MGAKSKADLKEIFKTGEVVTEQDMADLIDSYENNVDTDIDTHETRITNLEDNQVTGVESYATLASLPATGTLLVSYKVTNDATASNNGYYHWNGSAYVKDDDFVDDRINAQAMHVNLDAVVPLGAGSYYTITTALAELNTVTSEAYKYLKSGMFLTFLEEIDSKEIQKTYQHVGQFTDADVYDETYCWIEIFDSGLQTLLDKYEFIVQAGGLINASTGNPTDGDYLGAAGYTTALMKVKPEATEIIVRNNAIRWYAFYTDYPFVNTNAILPRLSTQPVVVPKGAKYFACTFQDSLNTDGYDNLSMYCIGHDKPFLVLHNDTTNVLVTADDTTEGYFIEDDGTAAVNAAMAYDKYIIDEDVKRYFVVAAFSTGISGIYVAHYFDVSDNYLGNDIVITSGVASQTDWLLRPHADTSYILINRQLSQSAALYEYSDDYIDVKTINDIVNVSNFGTARMKVWFDAPNFYIRTQFDATRDLILMYYDGSTLDMNITPYATYLGLKTESDAEILASTYVHYMYDSTGPIWMAEYWYLFAQHGYLIPKITCTHDKVDPDDIGSIWADNLGNNYELGKIDGSVLYFLPEITIGGTEGLDTRSWQTPSDNDPITGFTHVSGATNTTAITVISDKSTEQISPIQIPSNRTFTVDGKKITDFTDTYYCDEFTASEVLSCLNPTKVTQWFPTITYPASDYEMARITQSYTFTGKGCAVNTLLDVKYPLQFQHYGANQARTLVPITGFDSFAIIPKVNAKTFGGVSTDFTKAFETSNWETNGSIRFHRDVSDLIDVDDLPDRIITWLENTGAGTFNVGFASGLSLTKGITVNATRLGYVPAGTGNENEALYFSPHNRNKFYVRAIEGDTTIFPNQLLPESFFKEINYYWSYFDPSLQDAKVYDYKDGKNYILYIHHEAEEDRLAVIVPEYLEGLTATVIEKTTGAELLTTTVQNNTIYISTTAAANYLVLSVE